MTLKEEIEKIIEEAVDYDEEIDAQDGLTDVNGDAVPDYDWTVSVKAKFTDQLLALFKERMLQLVNETGVDNPKREKNLRNKETAFIAGQMRAFENLRERLEK